MDWLTSIAEEKIKESIRKGEFDKLPGAGKPLQLDDDSMVPEDLRVSYRLLKNAGMLPEEMQLRKDMITLQDLLACCRDDQERTRLGRELTAKTLRYRELMETRGWSAFPSAAYSDYETKLREKLTRSDERRDGAAPGPSDK